VGLLCANKNIIVEDVLYDSQDLYDFKGGMTENYVCQQLTRNSYTCYSWQSDGVAEIDFIIQRDKNLVPVEVKSSENRQAKSLALFMKRYNPEYAVKISTNNFGFEKGVKTIPLYATFCL
jgi:predicted AAA+ superfamily ATPase